VYLCTCACVYLCTCACVYVRLGARTRSRPYVSTQHRSADLPIMKTPENFNPEPLSARHHDSFVPAVISFVEDDYSKARKQTIEQAKAAAVHNPSVAHMLDGFSIGTSQEVKHIHIPNFIGESHPSTKQEAKQVTEPVSPKNFEANNNEAKECEVAYATLYKPTGNKTADGSTYDHSANTGHLVGAAVDLREPILGAKLGQKLEITNIETGQSAMITVRDKGGFGRLSTPDELYQGRKLHRGVDLTTYAAELIGSGGMTKVEVCRPAIA
jgi:rare lipoprotein A (peptidoglycan hydrolase)